MVTYNDNGLVRVTVTLNPQDVDLLDRLAALEGLNRSVELRAILTQLRPTLIPTVEALEAALRTRDDFSSKVAQIGVSDLEELMPEVEKLHRQYLGAISRLEGKHAALAEPEPPSSNTGVTPPPPTNTGDEK